MSDVEAYFNKVFWFATGSTCMTAVAWIKGAPPHLQNVVFSAVLTILCFLAARFAAALRARDKGEKG
jgi:membrane protein implicated in regulation of membrane protease activity